MSGGDGQRSGDTLRNGIILQNQEDLKEVIQGIAEIKSEIKNLVNFERQTRTIISSHLKSHSEKPETFLLTALGKIGARKWKAVFAAFFLFQVILAVLIFKYGLEKIIGVFK